MDSEHLPIKRSRTRSTEHGHLDPTVAQKWSKEELLEKFLSLYYENNQQKQKIREYDDENKSLKLMNVKVQDKMRHMQAKSGMGPAELRATDQVTKLELRLVELERQNAQLQSQATLRTTNNSTAPAAGGGGSHRRGSSAGGYRGGRGSNSRLSRSSTTGGVGGGGEAQQLRLEVESLKEQLLHKDLELRGAVKEVHSERDLASMHASDGQQTSMQDGLEKVRLQRLLREKATVVDQLQIRCETLEERIRDLQSANATLMQSAETARVSARLREQQDAASFDTGMGQVTQKRQMQLEHALEDAKAEAQVLRDTNEKLISSAFDTQKERQWRTREMALMAQIRQLEAGRAVGAAAAATASSQSLRADQGDSELERELSAQRVRYYELQLKYETQQQRLSTMDYRKQGITDEEFQSALALVRRQQESADLQMPPNLAFLKTTSSSKIASEDQRRRLLELEAAHADTLMELEKAREMLRSQQLLNNDTKAGHSLTESRLQEVRNQYDVKIGEMGRLLEIRSARIHQLEEQLAAASYGGVGKRSSAAVVQEPAVTAVAVSRPQATPRVQPKPRQQQPQSPLTEKVKSPTMSSPAGSVVEESCVEKIQGMSESAYRSGHNAAAKRRPPSGQVMGAMAFKIGAPPDVALPAARGGGENSDAESVQSVVPEPIKVKPGESGKTYTKESIILLVDSKLHNLDGTQRGSDRDSSLPPPPPYDEPYRRSSTTAPVTEKVEKRQHKEQHQQPRQHPKPEPRKQRQQLQLEPDSETEEDNDVTQQVRGGEDGEDSDAVVVLDEAPEETAASSPSEEPIVSVCYVQVFEVSLNEGSKTLANSDLDETGCYVSFDLPGYIGEESETPLSLRTPRPGVSRDSEFTLRYNFKRFYDFHFDKNYQKRVKLATLLLSDQPTLTFTLVSEALDGSDFFMEVAQAKLPLKDLVDSQNRSFEKSLTLTSMDNVEPVGTIKVGLDLPHLLRAVRKELPQFK